MDTQVYNNGYNTHGQKIVKLIACITCVRLKHGDATIYGSFSCIIKDYFNFYSITLPC